jgi:multicomponent Na+:H+ antiporter subunit C
MEWFNSSYLSLGLFFIGLFGVLTQRNVIKTIISINIMDAAAILFLITTNLRPESVPPLIGSDPAMMADPVPQALMITAIVIGVSVTAMCLALFIRMAHRYGSSDWEKIVHRMED